MGPLNGLLHLNVLVLVLLIPLAGFFVVTAAPRKSRLPFLYALITSLCTFLASLALIPQGVANGAHFSSVINSPWIDGPGVHISMHLGVDGISLWLILLTTFLLPIAVWSTESMVRERRKSFFAMLMLFEFGLLGVFSALDLFAFYIFWEVALVPMYLMVGAWGKGVRGPAAVKFFVYTMTGSVLMLGSVIYLHSLTGSFDYVVILNAFSSGQTTLTDTQQLLIFCGFFAAFAVKVPIFPFHTWLPNAYAEAPMPATFLLAAAMSKMGTYGLLRYGITLAPSAAQRCAAWIEVLAIIGIIYGGLLALIQPNIKRLIAYSSVSHLGFIVLGIFAFNQQGADGAVYQMLAHGLSTGALFLIAGYMEKRRHSLDISEFGGIARLAPGLAVTFSIAMLASIGLPMLCNFVGEFLVLQGAALAHFPWAAWAAVGVILSAAYMLWMYQRTFLGRLKEGITHFHDLTGRECAPLVPLMILMIWLGSYTQSFMPSISSATSLVLAQTTLNNQYRVKRFPPALPPPREPSTEVANAR